MSNIIDFEKEKQKRIDAKAIEIIADLYEIYGEEIFEDGIIQIVEKPTNDNIPDND